MLTVRQQGWYTKQFVAVISNVAVMRMMIANATNIERHKQATRRSNNCQLFLSQLRSTAKNSYHIGDHQSTD